MLGYDVTQDPHRINPGVHYRLYWSKRKNALVVICVQDFDYFDYDDDCFVNYAAYRTEADADVALAQFLTHVMLIAAAQRSA